MSALAAADALAVVPESVDALPAGAAGRAVVARPWLMPTAGPRRGPAMESRGARRGPTAGA